jgi:hypothetical protein
MGLSSVNIAQAKKLSIKGVRLQPAAPSEPNLLAPPQVKPTLEELVYSNLVSTTPGLKELVDRLDLVSELTGQRIAQISHSEEINSQAFIELANRLLQPQTSYSEEEVKQRISQDTRAKGTRLDEAFYYLLRANAIEQTPAGKFYLSNSTPF